MNNGHESRHKLLLREAGEFNRRLKPEGVTRVTSGGRDFTFIVSDTSGYVAMN